MNTNTKILLVILAIAVFFYFRSRKQIAKSGGDLNDSTPNDNFNAGYNEGYNQGNEDGYNEGYDDGNEDGYNEGYDDGNEDGGNGIYDNVGTDPGTQMGNAGDEPAQKTVTRRNSVRTQNSLYDPGVQRQLPRRGNGSIGNYYTTHQSRR